MTDERATTDHVLLLDTGDALVGGGALGDVTEGRAVVAGMNLMDYDAMAIGPKELSLGAEGLASRIAESEFPMLAANVVRASDETPVADAYTVVERGGHRIGIIGLTRPVPDVSAEFRVDDPVAALERVLPEVSEQAGTIVALTNLDLRRASDYADRVSGTDLWVASLPEIQPTGYTEAVQGGTYVVSAEQARTNHSGRRVGRLAVEVASDGSLTPVTWQTLAIDKTLEDDPGMDELLSRHWTEFWGPAAAPID